MVAVETIIYVHQKVCTIFFLYELIRLLFVKVSTDEIIYFKNNFSIALKLINFSHCMQEIVKLVYFLSQKIRYHIFFFYMISICF